MWTGGAPSDRLPSRNAGGRFTSDENDAIRAARIVCPNESQRSLAKRLYKFDPVLRTQARTLQARTQQAIYGAIRRYDQNHPTTRETGAGPAREATAETTA